MIILKAPYPNFINTLILPNPKFGDSNTVIRETNIKRGVDGTPYTYVKTTDNVRLVFQIDMTRQKSLELDEFMQTYAGVKWMLTDHDGISYSVVCLTKLHKQNFRRAWYNPTDPYGSAESVTIDLEFEATPL